MTDTSSIYGNVYNYYHAGYETRSSSRFDSHKKSDLKKIYNNIVQISKEEPIFLFRPSVDIEQYSISMKESAMQFCRDISSMGGFDGDKLFEQKTISSSDSSIVEASALPGSLFGNSSDPVELTIENLAKHQINKGKYLPSDSRTLDEGAYSFDVSTPSSNYELQFNIGSSDTNITIQNRLARLINNASIGLTASVQKDGLGNSALILESVTNGPSDDGEPPFELSDNETSHRGGILDYLGIREITEKAGWAHYTVNGEPFSSPENSVSINNAYQALLKKETTDNQVVTIAAKADYESLRDHIIGVAGSYNQFIRTASEYLDKHPRTSVLVDSMKRMESFYSPIMEKLGIQSNSTGILQINENTLDEALRQTITGDDISSLKKFTRSAMNKITKVQLNPMDYVDKRIVAYKNPQKSHFANPYITSAYSGMLFNSYM